MVRPRRDAVSCILRQSILELCKANVSQDRGLEIDGILCVTFGDDSDDQIVVKVHEKITSSVSLLTDLTKETSPVKYGLSQQNAGNGNRVAIKRVVWEGGDAGPAKKIPRKTEEESGTDYSCEQQGSAAPCCSSSAARTGCVSSRDAADGMKQHRGDGIMLLKGSTEVKVDGDATIDYDDSDGDFPEQTNGCYETDTSDHDMSSRQDVIHISGDDQNSTVKIKREVISDDDNDDFSVCLNDEFPLPVNSSGSGQFNSTSDQYLVCEFCQCLVADFDMLKEHCSSNHGAFTCPMCCRSFLQFVDYETHLQVHCKDPLTDRLSESGHQSKCPTGHRCGVCGHVTDVSSNMMGHLSMAHEFDSVFTCSLCSEYFPNMPTFVIHRKLTHPDVLQCRCKTCDVGFTAAEFAHHKEECSNNVHVTFSGGAHSSVNGYGGSRSVSRFIEHDSLSDCGDVVKLEPEFNEENFTDVATTIEGDESNLQNIGLRNEVTYDGFTTHCIDIDDCVSDGNSTEMLAGMPVTPRRGFRSRIQKNLLARQLQGEFSCENCREKFAQFSDYEMHCRLRHGRFVCPYCVTSFANRRNQQRHTRKHTGEQPYVCPHCPLKFYRDDDLRRHKLKHPGAERGRNGDNTT